jgi:hypothetical protein
VLLPHHVRGKHSNDSCIMTNAYTHCCLPVQQVVQAKVPNLHNLGDISEYVQGGYGLSGAASDSEMEDEDSKVELPDRYSGRGNSKAQTSSIRLQELGPRISMTLMKVERGLAGGDVLYHSYLSKVRQIFLFTLEHALLSMSVC